MRKGQRVVIVAGRLTGALGTVTGVFRERGCGCRSVIVRLDSRGEWAGKETEVRPA